MSLDIGLHPGRRLTWEGERWTVVQVGADVRIRDERGGEQVLPLGLLMAQATLIGDTAVDPDIHNARLLDLLDKANEAKVQHRYRAIEWLERADPNIKPADITLLGPSIPPRSERERLVAASLGVGVEAVRKMVKRYRQIGLAALVDKRWLRQQGGLEYRLDPVWIDLLKDVLASYVNKSTPLKSQVLTDVARRVLAHPRRAVIRVPSQRQQYRVLNELTARTAAFGDAKRRRSIANQPDTPFARFRATRPGEVVMLDSTPLDVYAMDRGTGRWTKVELSVAIDLYSRVIPAVTCTPHSVKGVDLARLLYELLAPAPERPGPPWPYLGIPDCVAPLSDELDLEEPSEPGVGSTRFADSSAQAPLVPAPLVPENIVVDRGKQYMSEHVQNACALLGIDLHPARPRTPTDKAAVERFFRTLREGLLVHLPGYKGPDVKSRGEGPESEAFYFVDEIETIIREWIHECYHQRVHKGFRLPEDPMARLTPLQALELGLARRGTLRVPRTPDVLMAFLRVEWRTIQPHGVTIKGLTYDGDALEGYRLSPSGYGGQHVGKWPFRVDPRDVRRIFFQDPFSKHWHTLRWVEWQSVPQPFSDEVLRIAKRYAKASGIDVTEAVTQLLERWVDRHFDSVTEQHAAMRRRDELGRLLQNFDDLDSDEDDQDEDADTATQGPKRSRRRRSSDADRTDDQTGLLADVQGGLVDDTDEDNDDDLDELDPNFKAYLDSLDDGQDHPDDQARDPNDSAGYGALPTDDWSTL